MSDSTRKQGGNDTSGFFQNIGPWYMLRLKFMPTWLADRIGFNIFLHLFLTSDRDVPHDHPWDSNSIILWGRLRERRQVVCIDTEAHYDNLSVIEYETTELPKWKVKFREAKYRHAVLLDSKFALTVFIPQKTKRPWYFYPNGNAVYWRTFLGLEYD